EKGVATEYQLTRFQRSNQNTNLNQQPVVSLGQKVKKGDVIADGPASQNGRLALGQNVLVALMPFDGYNFEDAIVLSESLVRRDIFTSVHIEKFEKEARDTKLGPEKITRDIPGLSEAALRDLDEDGVVRARAAARRPGGARTPPAGSRPVTAASCCAPSASAAATPASSSGPAFRRWSASTWRRSAA